MANVITRFKLETTQYDSKLRDASQALSQYARQASFAGSEFQKFTKDQAESARALGNIATAATNSKDKVKELVAAYNEAAKAYNGLTKEQQQSDWGTALSESLNKLKGRIGEAKQELYSMTSSGSSAGGVMGMLKDKLMVNIDALKLFNIGLTAAKTALNVAKDAFFSSEANVDEWNRTVASAKSVYEGFLTSINSGDISGYLSNIDKIVQAAREAYNELDKLGTMRTIQSPQMSRQEAENARLRTMLMTGRFIEAGDGRKSPLGLKTGDKLTDAQLRTLEKQLQNGMQKIVSLVGNEVTQTGRAIDAYYNKLAATNGMSLQEFREGTSSWAAYQQKMAGYEKYLTWRRENSFVDPWGNRQVRPDNPYQQYKAWGVFRVDKMGENSYNDLVNLIKQQQQQQQQMYSTLGQAYRTINRTENRINSTGGGGRSGGGRSGGGRTTTGTTDIIPDMVDLSASTPWANTDALTKGASLTIPVRLDIQSPEEKLREEADRLQNLLRNAWSDAERDALRTALDEVNGELDRMTGRKRGTSGSSTEIPQEIAKITGGVNNIFAGIQQLGLNVPEGIQKLIAIMQGTNTILGGIMAVTTIIEGQQTAQTAAAIANALVPFHFGGVVHAANGFAGKVPGTAYSGDNIPALLDAGEVVLTRAMAGNVASQLEGNNLGNLQLEAVVYAEQLRFLLRNNSMRRGKGEYITSKMRY